jgi:hypothetical protein
MTLYLFSKRVIYQYLLLIKYCDDHKVTPSLIIPASSYASQLLYVNHKNMLRKHSLVLPGLSVQTGLQYISYRSISFCKRAKCCSLLPRELLASEKLSVSNTAPLQPEEVSVSLLTN